MKAVFFGCWGIGQAALQPAVLTSGWEVVAVFTRAFDPDSIDPWRNVVWKEATDHEIPVYAPKRINDDSVKSLLRDLNPDLFLVAAFPRLLDAEILSIPHLGTLNLHGSLLPRNRGTSPVNWALIRDEQEMGLTMHYIDVGMDTGDIVLQHAIQIRDDDTLISLADKIKSLAPDMVWMALTALGKGEDLPRQPQEHGLATLAPRLRHPDCRIDWTQGARRVWSLIRGTSHPSLGAWSVLKGREVVIWRSVIGDAQTVADFPGTVISVDRNSIGIACGLGNILVPLSQLHWRENGDRFVPRLGDQFG